MGGASVFRENQKPSTGRSRFSSSPQFLRHSTPREQSVDLTPEAIFWYIKFELFGCHFSRVGPIPVPGLRFPRQIWVQFRVVQGDVCELYLNCEVICCRFLHCAVLVEHDLWRFGVRHHVDRWNAEGGFRVTSMQGVDWRRFVGALLGFRLLESRVFLYQNMNCRDWMGGQSEESDNALSISPSKTIQVFI